MEDVEFAAIVAMLTFLLFSTGGRTAWSSRVTIDGIMHSARYWYDGNYINNAKEDVAEVAYLYLTGGGP